MMDVSLSRRYAVLDVAGSGLRFAGGPQLPRELEPGFVQAVYALQEEKKMPYVNMIERV